MRRKLYAVDFYPARCSGCKGLSYVGVNFRYMLLLLVPELIAIVLIVGWSADPFLGAVGVTALLGVIASYQRLAPLVRISPQRVRFSRWSYAVAGVLILGLIALANHRSPEDLL